MSSFCVSLVVCKQHRLDVTLVAVYPDLLLSFHGFVAPRNASRQYTLLVLLFERGWNWLNTPSTTVRHNCSWLRLHFTASSHPKLHHDDTHFWFLRLNADGIGWTRPLLRFVTIVRGCGCISRLRRTPNCITTVHTFGSCVWTRMILVEHGLYYGSSQLFEVAVEFHCFVAPRNVLVERDFCWPQNCITTVLVDRKILSQRRFAHLVDQGRKHFGIDRTRLSLGWTRRGLGWTGFLLTAKSYHDDGLHILLIKIEHILVLTEHVLLIKVEHIFVLTEHGFV